MTQTAQYVALPGGQHEDSYACLLPLPKDMDSKEITSGQDIMVFLCVDISGSMSGTPLQQAKIATLSLIKRLRESNIENIIVVFWDDRVQPYEILGVSQTAIEERFSNIRARGGTSFGTCLEWVRKRIPVGQGTNNVLFLTDGQDGSGRFRG